MSKEEKKEEKNINRRDFLFTASYAVGAVGIGAVVWPLVDQMNPDKAQQALATTEVDISNIEPGKEITVLWRGKPVFLKRRTPEESYIPEDINTLSQLFDFLRMLDAEGYPRAKINTKEFTLEFSRPALRKSSIEATVKISMKNKNLK